MRSFSEDNSDALNGDGHRRVVVADGGRLPVSPRRFLGQPAPPRPRAIDARRRQPSGDETYRADQRRGLGSNDADYYSTYIVDKDGNEYEPYSLAWRYLGMYMDCDPQDYADDDYEGDDEQGDDGEGRRIMRERDLGGSQDGGNCERLLLWAAYVDHKYSGHSIGGYKFFDIETGDYDASTCQTEWWMPWDRCKRLDCHDPNPTNFELIGVFKETDGLYDWAEQLFKHQGYCVWDSDTYETMEDALERWPSYCWQLYYFYDDDGNSLYVDVKPLPEGNVTIAIYKDDVCSQESSFTWFDYLTSYYTTYGDEDQAESAIAGWTERITDWNEAMAPYKKCQPCRAYNLDPTSQGGSDYEGENSQDRRWLGGEDENDGEGEEEQYGYNCYDNAGYTNCNQCYKFFAKTDLEPASADDLELASDTILSIRFGGVYYGSGGFRSPPTPMSYALVFTSAAVGIALGLLIVALCARYRKRLRVMPQSLKEGLVEGAGGKRKSKKKRTRKRRNEDRHSSAYTEYSTSSSDDDDESRGGENFSATRLALNQSIDNVSESLKSAVNTSLDMAADLTSREELAMTRSLDNAADLLPEAMTQRLDMLVDYMFPVLSPEVTGAESYTDYDGTTTSFQEQDDEDIETRASSRGEEGDFGNQIKDGDTWIELPLKHKQEELDVSSIEALTTDAYNSEKSFDAPQASQASTDGSEHSRSYASSSTYQSPDEAVLYNVPRRSASRNKAAKVVDPPANQLSFASAKIDQVVSNVTTDVEGANSANKVTVETTTNTGEKDEETELVTSPTNETGTTAKEQKSACQSCLTVLALDSFPSVEENSNTVSSGNQPRDERKAGAVSPLISPDTSSKVAEAHAALQNDEDLPTDATKAPQRQCNDIDESETTSPETQSDRTTTFDSAATQNNYFWSMFALDSPSATPPTQKTDIIPTPGETETKDVAIADQTSSTSSAKEEEAGAFVGDVVETENETERQQSSNRGSEPVDPKSDAASRPLNTANANSTNDANIPNANDILIDELRTILEDHDKPSNPNDANQPIFMNEVISDTSSNIRSPTLDPSGTYPVDILSMLEDPSGTYTMGNPSLPADQNFLANASLDAQSALATTCEEEEADGADNDKPGTADVDDNAGDKEEHEDDKVSKAASKTKNYEIDATAISKPSQNQSCIPQCWALLALDDDHSTAPAPAPAPSPTPTASNHPKTTEHSTEGNTGDKIVESAAEQITPAPSITNALESDSHNAKNEAKNDGGVDNNADADAESTTSTRTKDPPGEPAKLVLQTTNESIINTTSHFDDEQVEEEDKDDSTAQQQVGGNACLEFLALD